MAPPASRPKFSMSRTAALLALGALLAAAPAAEGKRFDQHKIIFSPKGELLQLSYASTAVAKSAATAALKCKDGIVLCGLKLVLAEHAALSSAEQLSKLHVLDSHVAAGICGLKPDALLLTQVAKQFCAEYRREYSEAMPLHALGNRLGEVLGEFTFGLNRGRPLGASLLLAGYDEQHGYQIYKTEPTGALSTWKAGAVGEGSAGIEAEMDAFLQRPEEERTVEEAVAFLEGAMRRAAHRLGHAPMDGLGEGPVPRPSGLAYRLETLVVSRGKAEKRRFAALMEPQVDREEMDMHFQAS